MTVEEKANKYAEEAILALYSDSELMQDFIQKQKKYAKVDFLAGYNEAMSEKGKASETQIGGSHYSTMAIQPIEIIQKTIYRLFRAM